MSRSGAPRLPALAPAILVLAAVLYPGALLRGEAFFERDLHLDWYARLADMGRILQSGSWPVWEAGLGFGQPLLADPNPEVLYPATWLALVLPWPVAYTSFVLLHLVVAALGAARLARRLGTGRLGAWTAGLAFALSGPVQSALNLWHHFAGTAWMPWVLLAADTLGRRPSPGTALGFASLAALQVLAGSADLSAMTLALAALVVASRLVARRPHPPWRTAGAFAAALALAAALSCALWWPAAELVLRSIRRELPVEVRSAWSVPVAGLVRLAAPLDPARVPFEPGLWTRLYDRPSPPFLYSLYFGVPLLALAMLGALDRPRRGPSLLLALVAVATALVAMGPHGPLYGPLADLVPGLRSVRYPSKALFPAALAVSLLAGLGVRALARGARGRLAVAVLAGLGALAGALVTHTLHGPPSAAPIIGLAFALVLALHGRRVAPAFAGAALASLAVADLVAAHRDMNATVKAALLLEPPAAAAKLRVEDGRRVHIWDYHTLPGTAERLLGRADPYRPTAAPPGIDSRVVAFAAQRQVLVPPTAAFFGLETSYDLDIRGLYPRDMNDLTHLLRHVEGTPAHTRLLRLGAVARVLALHERGLEDLRLEAALPSLVGDPLRVYAVPDPLPRAWLVGRTRLADGEAAIRALLDPAFDPRLEAIVATGTPLAAGLSPGAAVRWLLRLADRQRLETESSGQALLALADAWDPGWRVTIDGAPAELVRANVAFRGVAVPAGRHVVELVYRPRSVVVGLVLSAGAWLGAAVLWVVVRRRRHATPSRGGRPQKGDAEQA